MRALLLVLCLAVAACAETGGSGCPPVAKYPDAFQEAAANELATLPAASPLRRMMDDYKKMRDQARQCRG